MTVDTTPQFRPAQTPVEPVRLLDEDGALIDGAEPLLDADGALRGLRLMMLGRAFDTKSFSLQRQGKLGTFAPVVGQEAASTGTALALDPSLDWLVPQYRELPAMLNHGHAGERIALYRMGHPDGGVIEDGIRVMQHQVSLAAQIPHAVGLAWGMMRKRESGVAVACFGDGASSEGDFHESCNLAGTLKAPVIFLLQNNQWAISTPREIQSAAADLASRAVGYGIHGVSVDGNDLLAVHRVAAEARARARAGDGPTIIEAHTFRMWAHTTADDPTRYVSDEDRARWEPRDPIRRLQTWLAAQGRWDEDTQARWESEVKDEVEAMFERAYAWERAAPGAIYEHVFREPTPALARQRAWDLQE